MLYAKPLSTISFSSATKHGIKPLKDNNGEDIQHFDALNIETGVWLSV